MGDAFPYGFSVNRGALRYHPDGHLERVTVMKKQYMQALNLGALYFVVFVWIEWEIMINTGRLWLSWQPFFFPFLFVDLVWMLGWVVEYIKELEEYQYLYVPDWIYDKEYMVHDERSPFFKKKETSHKQRLKDLTDKEYYVLLGSLWLIICIFTASVYITEQNNRPKTVTFTVFDAHLVRNRTEVYTVGDGKYIFNGDQREFFMEGETYTIDYYKKRDVHLARLRNEVTSPGGTSAEALYYLEKAGFRTALSRAIWAAFERSRELGKDAESHPPEP